MEKPLSINPEQNISKKDLALRKKIFDRMQKYEINPNENLGQHFLLNSNAIESLTQYVIPGNTVIEVGAGIGQVTEELAKKSTKLIAIEIDTRFQPLLTDISKKHDNTKIIFEDVLDTNFSDYFLKNSDTQVQIIASLPYHITEPFLQKVTNHPFESITLVVGKQLSKTVTAESEESIDFTKLSLLAQTFYDVEKVLDLSRNDFYPAPRTESAIIRLTPTDEKENRTNKRMHILKKLFSTARKSPLVKNVIKESLIDFAKISQIGTLSKRELHQKVRSSTRADLKQLVFEYNQNHTFETIDKPSKKGPVELTQNQARELISQMGISEEILNKPFSQLNNQEIRELSLGLRTK